MLRATTASCGQDGITAERADAGVSDRWTRHEQAAGHEAFQERMEGHPTIAAELVELSALLKARSTLGAHPVPGLEDTPLCLHADYGAREILTAMGWLTTSRPVSFQAGALSLFSCTTELLFVTLDNSEGHHDRIAYHDYAISAKRLHWQSQNSAGPDTPAAGATSKARPMEAVPAV